MTAPFEFRAESVRWTEELKLVVRKDGSLGVLPVLVDKRRETRECVPIDLPAADARRLLAWLRERYPDTDTGETK